MPTTIPSKEPAKITRGDSTSWTRAFSEYLPADGWTLTYYFSSSNGRSSVVATDNGDGSYLVSMATTDTAKLVKGRWAWQAVLTKAAERVTLDAGELEVVDGFATSTGAIDARSWARRTLDALEATLEERATNDQLSVSIAGRSISRMSPKELMDWRDTLRRQVEIEERGANAGLGRNIYVRFGRG